MAKTTPVVTAPQPISASTNVRTQEFGSAEQQLAEWLRLDLQASADVRTDRAMHSYNMATRHMVEAGLLLASVRAEVGAAAFADVLAERGMAKPRAYELMRGAALVARLDQADRERVMALHKTKVALLASATPATIEAALDDDEINIDLLGVRALRQRLAELEAGHVDLQVQRDTAEAEAEGLRKRLKRGLPDRADAVPVVVADLRAEILALARKATLAIDSYTPLAAELLGLHGGAAGRWADGTLRLAFAQLQALQVQLQGQISAFRGAFADGDTRPAATSHLTQQEMREAAEQFEVLAQTHTYEARLREWQREQARPRGKGRPSARPVPPAGAEA